MGTTPEVCVAYLLAVFGCRAFAERKPTLRTGSARCCRVLFFWGDRRTAALRSGRGAPFLSARRAVCASAPTPRGVGRGGRASGPRPSLAPGMRHRASAVKMQAGKILDALAGRVVNLADRSGQAALFCASSSRAPAYPRSRMMIASTTHRQQPRRHAALRAGARARFQAPLTDQQPAVRAPGLPRLLRGAATVREASAAPRIVASPARTSPASGESTLDGADRECGAYDEARAPTLEIADVIRRFGPEYRRQVGAQLDCAAGSGAARAAGLPHGGVRRALLVVRALRARSGDVP